VTDSPRRKDLPYVERPPLIKRPRKHYHYPSESEAELRAARDRDRALAAGQVEQPPAPDST
jgi:hypothetical protein